MYTRIRNRFVSTLVLSALLAGPAGAAVVGYHISAGGYGSGKVAFNTDAIVWASADHADGGVVGLADFTAFDFSFDGTVFILAEVAGQGAWFYGDNAAPEPDLFAGLELSASKGGDSIAFVPGFGVDPNDRGLFDGIGERGGDTGPIALTYKIEGSSVPLPPALAMFLGGLGGLGLFGLRRAGRASA